MKYLYDSLIICIQYPASLFLLYLVYLSYTKYRANGFTFLLLLTTVVPMFFFASIYLVEVFYTQNLINADNEEQLNTAYEKYMMIQRLIWWLALIGESTYNVAHWIFGLKYLTLAYKLSQ